MSGFYATAVVAIRNFYGRELGDCATIRIAGGVFTEYVGGGPYADNMAAVVGGLYIGGAVPNAGLNDC